MKNFVQKFLWVVVLTAMLASATSIGKAASVRSAPVPKNVKFETVVTGLNDPLLVTNAGDGSNRLFIVQRDGKILIHKNGGLNAAPPEVIEHISATRSSSGARRSESDAGSRAATRRRPIWLEANAAISSSTRSNSSVSLTR